MQPRRHAEMVEEPRRLGQDDFAQLEAEDVVIEEGRRFVGDEQEIDGVFLGAGDMLEEVNDLGRTQLARMPFLVKEDKAPCPLDGAFGRFGSPVVSQGGLADKIEEAGRLGCRCGGR